MPSFKVFAALLTLLIATICKAGIIETAFINEIHYDNAGKDLDEFVEIVAHQSHNIDNYSVLLVNGASGTSYKSYSLTSAATTFSDNGWIIYSLLVAGIQNGAPDGIALVGNNNLLLQFLSYEGTFVGKEGAINGVTSSDIGVAQTTSTAVGSSLQLVGQGNTYQQFTWQAGLSSTKGEINHQQLFQSVSDDTVVSVNSPSSILLLGIALLWAGLSRLRSAIS